MEYGVLWSPFAKKTDAHPASGTIGALMPAPSAGTALISKQTYRYAKMSEMPYISGLQGTSVTSLSKPGVINFPEIALQNVVIFQDAAGHAKAL